MAGAGVDSTIKTLILILLINVSLKKVLGFPVAYNAREASSIPGSGRCPGEENGNPPPVFLPGEFHGQRSLAAYSSWGHKSQT